MGFWRWLGFKLMNYKEIKTVEVNYNIMSSSKETLMSKSKVIKPINLIGKRTVKEHDRSWKLYDEMESLAKKQLNHEAEKFFDDEIKKERMRGDTTMYLAKFGAGVEWDLFFRSEGSVSYKDFQKNKHKMLVR